ncbi:MAG: MFS transporter [Desulfurococcaceae archaeon]
MRKLGKLSTTLIVFYMLGLVSLLADAVYEGGRSVSGAYLKELNAPAYGAALVGLGEFVGHLFRLLSGYLATIYQSSGIIWGFTIAGYALTAFGIPMLAFAPAWGYAVALYIAERIGKGLRAPTRDVILAEVSEDMGLGKGFGVHELLDQVGAFLGPLMVAFAVAYFGYRWAFILLLVPGVASLALVVFSYRLYPTLRSVSMKKPTSTLRRIDKAYWIYVVASGFLALGFMHWAIASYYLKSMNIASDYEIGLIYAAAMLVDAAVAVPLGILYDKAGFKVFIALPLLSFAFLSLIFALPALPRFFIYVLALPWGIVMCSEESVMRAALARIVEPSNRPIAYGVFSVTFGAFWAVGGYIYTTLLSTPTIALSYGLASNMVSLVLYLYLMSK